MRVAVRVERARRTLVVTLLVSALVKAATIALALLLLLAFVDLAAPLPFGTRAAALPGAVLLGIVVLAVVVVRGRQAFRATRVALYLEERIPALEYALVTAFGSTGPGAEALERVVDCAAPAGALRAPVTRALVVSGALLALPLVGMALLPLATRERVLHPVAGDVFLTARPPGPAGSRLATIAVRVTPPLYARLPEQRFEDPSAVAGLVGSRIVIRGRGAGPGVGDSLRAGVGEAALRVTVVGDTWSVSMPMPDKPVAVRLSDLHYTRLLALEPLTDRPPAVTLTAPARDTTYQVPRGRLALAGSARDDIGLARAELELMHTTGSGERFDIRRITLGGVSPGGASTASVRATLLLDTMRLGPGDVLHVRVVARDGNDATGPGEGASDTRTIRIVDPGSRDTIQLIPAGVAAMDTTMVSQRMLVIRAETLLVHRRRIAAQAFQNRARVLGQQQGMLRERVQAVIEELETAAQVGFTGATEASVMLGEAVAAMRLAQRELGVFRVKDALPHMYRALKALERVRTAERLYLRGVFPKLVVDLEKIRLKGTDKPTLGPREPRPPLADARTALRDRLDRALTLLARSDPGARDSLIVIRVDALTQAPDAAPVLARAIDAIGTGRDVVPLVATARRVLLRATEVRPAVPAWRGMP